MSLTAAMEEACASGGVPDIVAIQLSHPGILDGSVRFVRGIDGAMVDEETTIPLPIDAIGTKANFVPCAFELVRAGADKKGPTDGKLRLDGANTRLAPILEQAIGYGEPIRVTIWSYVATSLAEITALTEPAEMFTGLEMPVAQLASGVAEGAISYPDGRRINLPTGEDAFFDRNNYGGLFN